MAASGKRPENRYSNLVAHIFEHRYKKGLTEFSFSREDIVSAAKELGITLPKNIGDVIYSFRYRSDFPKCITKTQPDGFEWIILGSGKSKYTFSLTRLNRIVPRENLVTIKIPDATPEIIGAYALGDEQALLAKVRYNRLIDIFLGITAFSLQNHLRTTVAGIGQIEVDEIYVALDKSGRQYVVPVQAKGGHDKHGVVQTSQDIACCNAKFPNLICRPVSVQFMDNSEIAMFELREEDGAIKIVDEKHYQLVPANNISSEDLMHYRR